MSLIQVIKKNKLGGTLDIFDISTGTSSVTISKESDTNWWQDISNAVTNIQNSSTVQGMLSFASDVKTLSDQISSTIDTYSGNLITNDQLDSLKQIQQLISEGRITQSIPQGSNANDYQKINLGGTTYYVAKNSNLTKWLLIGGISLVGIIILIMILKRK